MSRLDAIRQVVDAEQLAAAVSWLLEDDAARKGMIEAAAADAAAQAGVLDKIVGALAAHLDRANAMAGPAPISANSSHRPPRSLS